MARAHQVKAARKAQGTCRGCGQPIQAGQAYTWWKFRYRGTLKVHTGCPTRRSWFTGSEIKGTLWDMVDDYTPEGETPEELADNLREFASSVQDEVVEGMLQEKLSNMEGAGTGLENTPVYEELDERKNELESWVQEMESVADTVGDTEPEGECQCEERFIEAAQDKQGAAEEWSTTEEHDDDCERAVDMVDLREQVADVVGQCPE